MLVSADRRGGVRRVVLLAAAAAAVCCWLIYCWEMTLTVPAGLDLFDFANNLLYAQDMLHGNWLLHGWVVTQDPHWLTDDMIYVVGLLVRGFDPVLLHAVPMFVYLVLLVLVASVSVAGLDLHGTDRLMIIGIAVLPLCFPSPALASQVLIGPYHTGTTAAALGAILALRMSAGRYGRAAAAGIVGGGLLLAMGRVGDPYMLTLGILPLILVSLYGWLVRPGTRREGWSMTALWVAVAAWIAAVGVLWLVPRLGGFTMRVSLSDIIPLTDLVPRVVDFIRTFLDLAGANFFGMSLGSHHGPLVIAVVRFSYLCLVLWAVVRAMVQMVRGTLDDWVTTVLTTGVILSAVGTFLYGPGDYLGDEHRTPVFLLAVIVLARTVASGYRRWLTEPRRKQATAAVLLAATVGFIFGTPPIHLRHPEGFDNPQKFAQIALARWLEQQGFQYGYGPYDEASIVTVETAGRVTVRPLISTAQYAAMPRTDARLIPNIELMADNAWFTSNHPATFLVVVDGGDVDVPVADQTFGAPDHMYRVGDFRVLTWNAGILCTLPPLTAAVRAEEAGGVPPRGASCRRLGEVRTSGPGPVPRAVRSTRGHVPGLPDASGG